MALYVVGVGPSIEYLSLKAIELLKRADRVYIDTYTSIAPGLERSNVEVYAPGAEIIHADRKLLENESHRIIEEAKALNVVLLVPGDPLFATTHVSLVLEAASKGVDVEVIPGVSGIQAVIDATGLQFYKFCRPITLVYPEAFKPFSVVETIWDNMTRNLHSLVLLDLRLDENRAMTINEAVEILLRLEDELAAERRVEPRIRSAILVGVARAGLPDAKCKAGNPGTLLEEGFPPPPHSLIVAAPRLHPVEVEALQILCECSECSEKQG